MLLLKEHIQCIIVPCHRSVFIASHNTVPQVLLQSYVHSNAFHQNLQANPILFHSNAYRPNFQWPNIRGHLQYERHSSCNTNFHDFPSTAFKSTVYTLPAGEAQYHVTSNVRSRSTNQTHVRHALSIFFIVLLLAQTCAAGSIVKGQLNVSRAHVPSCGLY